MAARFKTGKTKREDGAVKPLRYVIYLRKSSEGQDAQAQSIPDQLKACQQMALRDDLMVVGKPIEESASAWSSNNRPKFNQMLKDIANGKYDGIISYHPDRLSRNMLEGGMIMDMLDSNIIKDLRFPTLAFTNDSNGKLMLNILFAMAKNYTDHQSEVVQRGVDSNFEQGKSGGVHKWGYVRDEVTGYYIPDPEYFDVVKRGWEMRAEGKNIDEVVDYWKREDVHRMTKITRKNKKQRKIKLDSKQMVSKLFHDPIYYGVLVQAEQEVDLTLVTPSFKPMVDQATYNAVQAMGQKRSRVLVGKKRATFYPLRGMVFCDVCDSPVPMRVGKNKSASGKYGLTYRCDNKACTRSVKSVRAKNIFNELYPILDKLKMTNKEYDKYSKTIDQYTDEQIQELRTERRSLNGSLAHKKSEMDRKARQYGELPKEAPESVRKTFERDLEDLENEVIDLDDQVKKIEKKLADPATIKATKEEFLNLVNNMGDKMRAGVPVEKDWLARLLLLNIRLDNKNAPSFIWREPFASLVKAKKISLGARERT